MVVPEQGASRRMPSRTSGCRWPGQRCCQERIVAADQLSGLRNRSGIGAGHG